MRDREEGECGAADVEKQWAGEPASRQSLPAGEPASRQSEPALDSWTRETVTGHCRVSIHVRPLDPRSRGWGKHSLWSLGLMEARDNRF